MFQNHKEGYNGNNYIYNKKYYYAIGILDWSKTNRKKSIAEMTSYDLAAIMLLTTVAAEPLVYKIMSKATVGVFAILVATVFLGNLSLKKFFYNIDAKPTIVITEGKIIEKELKKSRMNVPLLLSELRIKGYQNVSDVKYAIIEPSGKLSVIPDPQASPVYSKGNGNTYTFSKFKFSSYY